MIQFNIQFKVESKIFIQKIIQFKKFKNYSKIIQFKKFKKLFIQIGKIIPAWENSENMQNGPFFPQNALVIHFSYECRTFFIHSKIHSIVRQKYSFKEFIHSIVRKNIHSKNVFIQKIIRLFIQWKYSFFLKMPYLPPLPLRVPGDKFWRGFHQPSWGPQYSLLRPWMNAFNAQFNKKRT